MRVRLIRITGVDLSQFEFDLDLTWMVFFLNAEGKVYGRYGGRDARSAEDRLSLAGLRYAMQAALDTHRSQANEKPAPNGDPFFAERLPSAKNYKGCIHCHQVKEIQRNDQKAAGTWNRDDLWVYPLPENVGIELEAVRGNVVQNIKPGSPADKIGLKPGDVLQNLNGFGVRTFADAQYALHKSPAKGEIPVSWLRGKEPMTARLAVADGWRKTNLTWRPSLLDLLPSLTIYGDDLTPAEKRALGLDEKRLAFRQQKGVPTNAREAGLQENDVIIGIDNQILEMDVNAFLGHVRRNYLVNDRITLNVVRNGKKLDLPLTLK